MHELSCIQNVKKVETDPYPYICIEGALPESRYRELSETFPMELICSTSPYDGGVTYRYRMKECQQEKPPAIWQDFFSYHTSKEYFQSCIELFAPQIVKEYGEEFMHKMLQGSVTPRFIDDSGKYVTDCQFVVHEPLDEMRTTRTPHLDNPVEIYAGLLYLKLPEDDSTGGNLGLHRVHHEISEVNKTLGREVANNLHTLRREVPYLANVFCMFLNLKRSVHSVSPRMQARVRRRSVNIVGEFNGSGQMYSVKQVKDPAAQEVEKMRSIGA